MSTTQYDSEIKFVFLYFTNFASQCHRFQFTFADPTFLLVIISITFTYALYFQRNPRPPTFFRIYFFPSVAICHLHSLLLISYFLINYSRYTLWYNCFRQSTIIYIRSIFCHIYHRVKYLSPFGSRFCEFLIFFPWSPQNYIFINLFQK